MTSRYNKSYKTLLTRLILSFSSFESNENKVESQQFSSSLEEQKQIPIVITVNESKDSVLDEKKSLLYSPRRFITLFSSNNERPFEDKENDLEIEYSQLSQDDIEAPLLPSNNPHKEFNFFKQRASKSSVTVTFDSNVGRRVSCRLKCIIL